MTIAARSRRTYVYLESVTKKCDKPVSSSLVRYTSSDQYYTEVIGNTGRPKPSSLIRNPTALGPYYRTEYDYAVRKYTEDWIHCDGYAQNTKKVAGQPTFIQAEYADDLNAMMASRVKGIKVNLASDLAEAKETAHSLTALAKAVGRGMSSVYRASRGKGWKSPRWMKPGTKLGDVPVRLASANLGISFGIAPLAGTVANSAERLRNRVSYPIYRHIKGSVYGFVDGSNATKLWATDGSRKASVWVLLSDSVLGDDFTVGNPGEWAWELIPFSFVIDWMLPIGRAISNLDAFTGVGGMWGTKTERTVSMVSSRFEDSSGGNNYYDWVVSYSKQTRGTKETYRRTVWVPDNTPRISWSPSQSGRSLANALSLLIVQRNKRLR